jgi:BMFP domain-containing protein YqiC
MDVHTLKIAALEKRIAELEAKLNSLWVGQA